MMRPLAFPLLISVLLPLLPVAADVAPNEGLQVEGVSPGARVTAVTPLRIHASGPKHITSIFVNGSPTLISNRETVSYRLDPAQWLAGKAERAVHLEVRIYAGEGSSQTLARTEMELTVARPADAPGQ